MRGIFPNHRCPAPIGQTMRNTTPTEDVVVFGSCLEAAGTAHDTGSNFMIRYWPSTEIKQSLISRLLLVFAFWFDRQCNRLSKRLKRVRSGSLSTGSLSSLTQLSSRPSTASAKSADGPQRRFRSTSITTTRLRKTEPCLFVDSCVPSATTKSSES